MNDLLNTNLPKWPQCIIVGKKLEPEQALEIIRRTDNFFSWGGGNNRQWNAKVERTLQIPQEPAIVRGETGDSQETRLKAFHAYWDAIAAWRKRWGHIATEYIYNSWISNAYIGGPCGWCHPDGTILFGENIGKWPSVQAVLEDWEILLEAFPFLTINCVLMDREHCEEMPKPLVALKIREGKIELVGPDEAQKPSFWEGMGYNELVHVQWKIQTTQKSIEAFALDLAQNRLDQHEIGLPFKVIENWSTLGNLG